MVGVAMARADSGMPYHDLGYRVGDTPSTDELNIEVTGRIPLAAWLLVQPDAQYVVDPGMNPTRKHALVAGLRVELTR